ncbi:MAG: hypothetical protein UW34_C0010G0004 [Parcubacteria group bacterium GW2011_GWA2_44_15]|nr:MAG: hypothetical protein UW34_C0010G0004 [Parcubacteria group bacterium GW2011_GWA2_44_15]
MIRKIYTNIRNYTKNKTIVVGAGGNLPFKFKSGFFKQRASNIRSEDVFRLRTNATKGLTPINYQHSAQGFQNSFDLKRKSTLVDYLKKSIANKRRVHRSIGQPATANFFNVAPQSFNIT